jgi:ubiquinone biosynthesis monooxygenase Coq6
VARKAGIRSTSYNYGQRAVTCTVRTRTENDTAFQRFLSTGPIALLPVRDGYSNVVWSTTVSQAKHLEGLSSKDFAKAVNLVLNQEPKGRSSSSGSGLFPFGNFVSEMSSLIPHLTGKSLGGGVEGQERGQFIAPPEVLEVVGTSQKSFPLKMKHALTYCHRSVALVGDAAHSIHPLAGQGVNIGFGDVEVLVETLQEALWSGMNYSDLLTLEKYSNKRHGANAAMIRTLEAVKAVYQSQFTPLAVARNMGMGILNSVGALKGLVVGYASSNASASKINKGSSSSSAAAASKNTL